MDNSQVTIHELTESLRKSDETIRYLTESLAKTDNRYQSIERILRWVGVIVICLTMMTFYIGFNFINPVQATNDEAIQSATATQEVNQADPTIQASLQQQKKEHRKRASCQQAMPLMMIKQMPDPKQFNQMGAFGQQMQQQMEYMFNNPDMVKQLLDDNAKIFCNVLLNANRVLKKVNDFKAEWSSVRNVLLKLLHEEAEQDENNPMVRDAKRILAYLSEEKALENRKVKKAKLVDSALLTYLLWGTVTGLSSLDELEGTLKVVPEMTELMHRMNINMEDMSAHMYYMNQNMGIMSYDIDSTMGRAGRWMPW